MVNRIYEKVIIAVLAISLSLSGIVSAGAAEKKEQFAVIPAQENVKLLVNNKKQYFRQVMWQGKKPCFTILIFGCT